MLEPLNLTWLEEPVQWQDDRRLLNLLRKETRIPLSAGENEVTAYGCRAMLEEKAVQVLQFDCVMSGGFTEGRKLAALCELNHVQAAPHHDCFIHAHIVAGSPAGRIVESFDPERDPLSAELCRAGCESRSTDSKWSHRETRQVRYSRCRLCQVRAARRLTGNSAAWISV